MCGHVGIAGRLDDRDKHTIKRMLLLDYFRGTDSTGLAAISRNGSDGSIAKIASHPLDLFDTKRFEKILMPFSSSAFIGHNRATTKGATNEINAHPFQFGHIIGCHNGTLSYSSFSELNSRCTTEHDVDSAAIFEHMSIHGVEDTASRLQGAWALVWADLRDKTINFLRNDQRPFWLAYTKTGDRIFWASEHPMIKAATALSANKYDMYTDDKGHGFWSLPVNEWWRCSLPDLAAYNGTSPFSMNKTPLKGKEPVPVVVGHSHPFQTSGKTGTFSGNSTTISPSFTKTSPDSLVMYKSLDDQFDGVLGWQEFITFQENGCSWCGGDITYSMKGLTYYEEDYVMLCPTCSSHDNTRIYVTSFKHIQGEQYDTAKPTTRIQ